MDGMIPPDDQALRLAEGVTFQTMDAAGEGEGVVVALDDGQFYACNGTTLAFLEAVDGRRSLNDITHLLHEQYEVAYDQLREDLRALLGQLVADKLIEPNRDA